MEEPGNAVDGYAHEALHTLMIVSDLFGRHVTESVAVKRDEALAAMADDIAERLGMMYQAVGEHVWSD